MSIQRIISIVIFGVAINAFFFSSNVYAAQTDGLRINEIMYYPPEQSLGKNLQWIELYNQSDHSLSISGGMESGAWTLSDNAGTHYFAPQAFLGSMTIASHGYAIIAGDPQAFLNAHPSFVGTIIDAAIALPFTQGTVVIKDETGKSISQASWTSTQGGAGDEKTLEFSTQDNAFRESLVVQGTPGQKNSVEGILLPPITPTQPPVVPKQSPQPTQPSEPATIIPVINEIYANPLSGQSPWLELKNENATQLQLEGWGLYIKSPSRFVALNGVMTPQSFMIVSGAQWGFTLDPNADTIQILDPQKNVVFEVTYAAPLPRGWSANRVASKSWKVSDMPTPGKQNVIHIPDITPIPNPVSEVISAFPFAAAYEPTPNTTVPKKTPSLLVLALEVFGAGIVGTVIFFIAKKKLLY